MLANAWSEDAAPAGGPSPDGEAPTRAALGPADLLVLVWRERKFALAVFAVIALASILLALAARTTYPARSSLLIRLGQEYVYEPRAGDAARGAVPESDQVIQAEVEILSSAQLKERVIETIGVSRFAPGIAGRYERASLDEQKRIMAKLVAGFDRSLKITTTPGAPVVRLEFDHPDPDMAALVLNTLLDEYVKFRRGLLLDRTSPIDAQRRVFEAKLGEVDAAYQSFLGTNNIGDFDAEKSSLGQILAQLKQQKFDIDAQLSERAAKLAAVQREQARLAPEIGLYHDVDHQAQDKLAELRVQKAGLLGRYRADAAPVKAVDAEIASLEQAVSEGRAAGDGARRLGINPVYQTAESDRIQLAADVSALARESRTLGDQITDVTNRQIRLAQLEPRFQDLSRERDVLSGNVKAFAQKEQEAQAADAIARDGADNISVVQRAVPPAQGKSLKGAILLVGLAFALLTAGCAALIRGFARPGFPTAASAARTLGLPLLGSAMLKPDTRA